MECSARGGRRQAAPALGTHLVHQSRALAPSGTPEHRQTTVEEFGSPEHRGLLYCTRHICPRRLNYGATDLGRLFLLSFFFIIIIDNLLYRCPLSVEQQGLNNINILQPGTFWSFLNALLRASSTQLGLDIIARIQFWQLLDFSQTDFQSLPMFDPSKESVLCSSKNIASQHFKYGKHRQMLARETNSFCFVQFFFQFDNWSIVCCETAGRGGT